MEKCGRTALVLCSKAIVIGHLKCFHVSPLFFSIGTKIPLSGHIVRCQSYANFVKVDTKESWKRFSPALYMAVGPSQININDSSSKTR